MGLEMFFRGTGYFGGMIVQDRLVQFASLVEAGTHAMYVSRFGYMLIVQESNRVMPPIVRDLNGVAHSLVDSEGIVKEIKCRERMAFCN